MPRSAASLRIVRFHAIAFLAACGSASPAAQAQVALTVDGANSPYTLTGTLTNTSVIVGFANSGVFNNNFGGHTINTSLTLGNWSGSSGTYNTSGGLSVPTAYIGYSGSGTVNQTAGTVTISQLYLGFASGTGTYSLSGGTLNVTDFYVGNGGTGTVNQSGGVITATKPLRLPGLYNFNGGTLIAPSVFGLSAAARLNFNGGTFQPSADGDLLTPPMSAEVQAGGAVISLPAGRNSLLSRPLLHDDTVGAPAVDGGLTVRGAATLTIAAINTYTGPTVVNSTVNLNAGGSLSGGGSVQVKSNGILNVGGTVLASTLTVDVGGSLNINGGNVSAGGLSANNGATITVGNSGRLSFGSSVTTGATINLVGATLAPAASSVITYAGATVNGGFLGVAAVNPIGGTPVGFHSLGNGTLLNGVIILPGTIVNQSAGSASIAATTIRGALTMAGGTTLDATGTSLTGSGSINVGGTLNANGFESAGVITILGGSRVNNSGSSLYLTGGGRTTVNSGGVLASPSDAIEVNGALLMNNGAINGTTNVHFNSLVAGTGTFGPVNLFENGRFAPGATASPTLFSAATVTVEGDLSLSPDATLATQIGGAAASLSDRVSLLGNATLAGTLDVATAATYTPSNLSRFVALTFDSHDGTFSTYVGMRATPQLVYAPIYSPTDLTLVAALPGDANLSGAVGFDDLVTVAQNYNLALSTAADSGWTRGDFTYDGKVDFNDLVLLAQNYGASGLNGDAALAGPGYFAADWAVAQSLAPEPLLLLALPFLAFGRRPRRF